jgi:hypothetical protein
LIPSGANGPVKGNGAPKRITSSADATETDALQPAIAMNAEPRTTDKRDKIEPNIHVSRKDLDRNRLKHGKSEG